MDEQNLNSKGYNFHTRDFDGPLDLLLYQIQKAEINIYDIPIAEITEQFLVYIKNEESIGLKDLSAFYKMAADLLFIKSKMLLPIEIEFDEEYEDPRQDLVEKLLEYQKYKKLTELLTNTSTSDSFFIEPNDGIFTLPFADKDLFKDVNLSSLLETFSSLIEKAPSNKLFNIYEEVSEEEKVSLLLELLEEKTEVEISEVILDFTNIQHIICTFFAILTLCAKKLIVFRQDSEYKAIYLSKRCSNFDLLINTNYDIVPLQEDEFNQNDDNPCGEINLLEEDDE